MRPLITAVLLLVIALPLVAQEQGQLTIKLPPQMGRVLRDYETAWTAKNPDALAELFTEDGFVLSSGKPPVRGRAAIREAYKSAGGPLLLRAMAFSVDGELGYIIGGYATSKHKPDVGKFVLLLKWVDGKWLIAADMDNSNSRPQPPPPAPAKP